MKGILILFTIAFLWLPGLVLSQGSTVLQPGSYIIVSAYATSKEAIAIDYVQKLKSRGLEANYGLDAQRNLYLVYIASYDDRKLAIERMTEIRAEGTFTDAWVRVVTGAVTKEIVKPSPKPIEDDKEDKATPSSSPIRLPEVQEETRKEQLHQPDAKTHVDLKFERGRGLVLNLFNATSLLEIKGEIDIVDSENARIIKSASGNVFLPFGELDEKKMRVSFITRVFGYQRKQYDIDFPVSKADATNLPYIDFSGDTLIIHFEMQRLRKGDIQILHNVYFYNDAAIMLPDSKFELNALLELLKENPNYSVRLNGHTNGAYRGRIISLGKDREYFQVSDGADRSSGSAKKLSKKRAEIIKEWLIDQGISSSRMQIKGWGGRRPMYDGRGVNARKNARVEVEIVKD
ncbi:MAG: OmpA family protein [Cyclobacteriaceae bacterium]|nr:OmpA family protein [Cyclobacteriaceae bacterium]